MSEPSAPRSVDETETMDVSAPVATPEGGAAVGATVSRYVVLEEVGRGGMGRVLRAYDPKLQREVALKEVHADQLDAEATARLVAEARAMAKLSHPNVVGVYDVEEFETVVLVMEYVAGQTLKQWLREETLPWRNIVQRFVAAGQGLVAAHEAGLLHRDFKPANVLVSDDGQVKVTDFGLAKARTAPPSGPSSAGDDDLTEVGTVLGTPRYMAPEQHRGESLSAAADQYSFCVSLWEALCGEPPFAGKTMADGKAAGPPPWPQDSTPRAIVTAIVRGLSPEADDRWPTMAALLEALSYDPARRRHRWLLGLGTLGALGLAGVSYGAWANARAQRCSGAHQQLAGIWDETLSAEVETAILGVGKSYAQEVWNRTQRELDAYTDEWAAMHTEACEATTMRGEQSPKMMDLRMGCLHRAGQELRATVETLADADDQVVQNAHKLTGGLQPLFRCADTEALTAEVEPPLPGEADAVEAARLELARAKSLVAAGRYEAAQRAVQTAKDALASVEYGPVQTEVALQEGDVLEKLGRYEASETALNEALMLGAQQRQWDAMAAAASQLMLVVGGRLHRAEEGLRYRPLAKGLSRGQPKLEVNMRNSYSGILQGQGKYAEAEAEYRATLSMGEKALGPEHATVAVSRHNLAIVLYQQGRYEESEADCRAALLLQEKSLGPDHPKVAAARNILANALQAQGKYAEAEAEHRTALALREKALGPEHPEVAASRNNLAMLFHAQGKYTEAEAEHRTALALREKVLGPDHPEVAASWNNLAMTLAGQGKYAEAEPAFRAALSLQEKVLGPEHPELASSHNNLGMVLYEQGKYAESEAEHRASLAIAEKALGPDHPAIAASWNNLAMIQYEQGKYAEAEAGYRAVVALEEKALGPEHPGVASSRGNLASVLRAQGKYAEAEAEHTVALSVLEKDLGPDHPDVALSRSNFANMLREAGRPAEALPLAEQAWARRQRDDIPAQYRGRTALVLAEILWTVEGPKRDRSRAHQLAEDALRSYRDAGEAHAQDARDAQQWLDAHRPR